jgi:hypothetical protein
MIACEGNRGGSVSSIVALDTVQRASSTVQIGKRQQAEAGRDVRADPSILHDHRPAGRKIARAGAGVATIGRVAAFGAVYDLPCSTSVVEKRTAKMSFRKRIRYRVCAKDEALSRVRTIEAVGVGKWLGDLARAGTQNAERPRGPSIPRPSPDPPGSSDGARSVTVTPRFHY